MKLEDKLVNTVLEWWDEHECDTFKVGEDEHNVFGFNPPEFVLLAQKINKRKLNDRTRSK